METETIPLLGPEVSVWSGTDKWLNKLGNFPVFGTDSGNRLGVEGDFAGVFIPDFSRVLESAIKDSDISMSSEEGLRTMFVQ